MGTNQSRPRSLGWLERRELDPVAAGPAAGRDGAVDEARAAGVDAEVELVELAVAGLVAIALHERLEPRPLLDRLLDLAQRVVPAVRRDPYNSVPFSIFS